MIGGFVDVAGDRMHETPSRPTRSCRCPERPAGPRARRAARYHRVDEARRRSLRRWAVTGAVAVAVAVVGSEPTATPLFHAQTIRVTGEHR